MFKLKNSHIVIGGFLLGIFLAVFLGWFPRSSSDAAAWVQAFGSIVAIIGAWYTVKWQLGMEGKNKRDSIKSLAHSASVYAASVLEVVVNTSTNEGIANPKIYDCYHSSFGIAYSKAIGDVPLHDVGSAEVVDALIKLSQQFVFFNKVVDKYTEPYHSDKDFCKRYSERDSDLDLFDGMVGDQYQEICKSVREYKKQMLNNFMISKIRSVEIQVEAINRHVGIIVGGL